MNIKIDVIKRFDSGKEQADIARIHALLATSTSV